MRCEASSAPAQLWRVRSKSGTQDHAIVGVAVAANLPRIEAMRLAAETAFSRRWMRRSNQPARMLELAGTARGRVRETAIFRRLN